MTPSCFCVCELNWSQKVCKIWRGRRNRSVNRQIRLNVFLFSCSQCSRGVHSSCRRHCVRDRVTLTRVRDFGFLQETFFNIFPFVLMHLTELFSALTATLRAKFRRWNKFNPAGVPNFVFRRLKGVKAVRLEIKRETMGPLKWLRANKVSEGVKLRQMNGRRSFSLAPKRQNIPLLISERNRLIKAPLSLRLEDIFIVNILILLTGIFSVMSRSFSSLCNCVWS